MRTSVRARRSSGRLLTTLLLMLALLPLSGLLSVRNAQAAYVNRFSSTTNGAITLTGNTLGLSKQLNANAAGTSDAIGAFITTNTTLRDGPNYPLGTTPLWAQDSSAAVLNIPAGSTVLHAELIWSGSYSYGGEGIGQAVLDTTAVSLTAPGRAPVSIAPDPATATTLGTPTGAGFCQTDPDTNPPASITPCFYVRSADVTALVQAAGAGTYVVGGVPGTQGSNENYRNNAGWTLAVAYGNPALPARNLTLFVGAEVTNRTKSTPVTVSGFCTPPAGAVAGRLFVSASEGDASILGDQMKFGPTAAALTNLSGPNNPVNNFFASQINNDAGTLDTSGTFGNRNQNAIAGTNAVGGRQGWDITSVDISTLLANAQTSAVAQGTSTGDQYVINALASQIGVGAPLFPINVKSVDKTQAVVGDILNYTIRVDNTAGTADAVNVIFKDTPPPGTSFVPGSLSVDGVAQPGANPIAGVNIGGVTMGNQPTSVKTVRFQARVDYYPSGGTLDNSASWDYQYVSCTNQPALSGSITTNQVSTQVLLPALAADKSALLAVDADGNGAISAGDTLQYSVAIGNTGAAPATNVVYTDIPDTNTALVVGSVTTSQGTVTKGNAAGDKSIAVNIGTLAAGATVTVTYRATIAKPLPATVNKVVNQGLLSSKELPPIPTNDPRTPPPGDPTVVPVPPAPLLTADKTASLVIDADGNGSPSAGDTLGYAVTISNIGTAPATGVAYTDTPDANTALVVGSVTTTQGTVTKGNTAGDASLAVTIGTLPVNASVTIRYRVTINNPLPASVTEIVNQGLATSNELPPIPTNDPRTPPPGDPTRVPITPPPLLTADKDDVLIIDTNGSGKPGAGDTLVYLVTIANRGNGPAVNVAFTDTPDPNSKLVVGSVQTSQGTVTKGNTAGDTSLAVAIGTIAPGGTVTIGFRALLNNPLPTNRIANQGLVTGGNIPNTPTNDPQTPLPGDPTVTIIPPGELTAVTLQSFTATRAGAGVLVRWTTTAEVNTWGFHLLRSADGRREHATRVTPQVILGRGAGPGASYSWTDTSAQPGVPYYYWLQEIELDGTINEYGPAAASAPAGQYSVLLPVTLR